MYNVLKLYSPPVQSVFLKAYRTQNFKTSKISKTWVKAGTFNAGNRKEDTTDKGKLYKPSAKIDFDKSQPKSGSSGPDPSESSKRPEKPGKKKQTEKKKSNLELFKEEL